MSASCNGGGEWVSARYDGEVDRVVLSYFSRNSNSMQ